MQVYLPDDLHAAVKQLGLPASELLQRAVRAELARRAALDRTDLYLEELASELGAPSEDDRARAEVIARRLNRPAS
ncbi:MAG: hypothetical protein OEY23_08760 [Acidimicrobiia bacterium]|nr:hypothetical protein [Acidimicrobiia bacterium]